MRKCGMPERINKEVFIAMAKALDPRGEARHRGRGPPRRWGARPASQGGPGARRGRGRGRRARAAGAPGDQGQGAHRLRDGACRGEAAGGAAARDRPRAVRRGGGGAGRRGPVSAT